MSRRFSVIGGDRRQAELARLLRADGHTVTTFGLQKWMPGEEGTLARAAEAEVIVLPLPLCREEGLLNCQEHVVSTRELFGQLNSGQLILAGQVRDAQRQEAQAAGLELLDYFQREELTVANAAATAEAAIQTAMERLEWTLLGTECLVLGFGRIGKLLSCRLQGLGAHVTAAARKPGDLAWIRAYGYSAEETGKLDGRLRRFDAVFNTIPSLVLDAELVKQLKDGCLCVDVASVPGIDLEAAETRGLPQVWARFLPGRMVPVTAALAIRDTIYYILEERGDPA